MRWLLHVGAVALVAAAVGVSGGSAANRSVPAPRTVASWAGTGSFAESMAYGNGALYVSRTTWGEDTNSGAIERVPLTRGASTTIVSDYNTGYGLFAGLAFDPNGQLYVALASFSEDVPTAILRVGPGGHLTPAVYLPTGSFPNGLAFYKGYLYVTDPALGAIWRVQPGKKPVTQTTPWLEDPLLAPLSENGLGPDGIAFRGHTLYVTQYDRGEILTVDLSTPGAPALHEWVSDPSLVTADGIAFDPLGDLWVTANDNRIVVVTPFGRALVLADGSPWLDYPTQPVFTPLGLFVANGSFDNGSPNVVGWTRLPF